MLERHMVSQRCVCDLLRHKQRQRIIGLRAPALMPSTAPSLSAGHSELLRKIGEGSEKRTWIAENA